MDFSGAQIKVHTGQCGHAVKALYDAAQAEERSPFKVG
jgi:hypothetical protein